MLKKIKKSKGLITTTVTIIGLLMWILNYVAMTYGLTDTATGQIIEKGIYAGTLFFIGLFAKDKNKTHSE